MWFVLYENADWRYTLAPSNAKAIPTYENLIDESFFISIFIFTNTLTFSFFVFDLSLISNK